jgi:hypothetical protein
MKIYHLVLLLVILVAGCFNETSGSIVGGLLGAVADGAVAGVAGTEPDSTFSDSFAKMGALQGQANKLGVDLKKIPKEWQPQNIEDARLEKRADGVVCYWLGDDHLAWNATNKSWVAED